MKYQIIYNKEKITWRNILGSNRITADGNTHCLGEIESWWN